MSDGKSNLEAPSFLGSMPIEKAKAIMSKVLSVGFKAIGFADEYEKAEFPIQYSLEEICIAARLVSEDNKRKHSNVADGIERSFMMTMADRGIAAHYALAHYQGDPKALLEAVGFTLSNEDE
jgi:hypothetical protein